jgi:hypothetical protein
LWALVVLAQLILPELLEEYPLFWALSLPEAVAGALVLLALD